MVEQNTTKHVYARTSLMVCTWTLNLYPMMERTFSHFMLIHMYSLIIYPSYIFTILLELHEGSMTHLLSKFTLVYIWENKTDTIDHGISDIRTHIYLGIELCWEKIRNEIWMNVVLFEVTKTFLFSRLKHSRQNTEITWICL